jgi:hypothetical protein
MPADADLPPPLRALAGRNAVSLGDAHWDADIQRLADSIGLPKPRARWPLAAGAAVLATALVGGWVALRPSAPPAAPAPAPAPDASHGCSARGARRCVCLGDRRGTLRVRAMPAS